MKVYLFDLLPYDQHFDQYKADRHLPYPLPGDHFDAKVAARSYEEHLAIWKEMDALGFDGVGLNEHHTTPHGLMNSPNMMAAVGAQHTRNLKFLLLGNLMPLHNPLRIAEELAMADCMSRGRILSGFARGVPREYKVYQVPMSESRARFEEAIEVVMKAWTQDVFSHEGKFWQYKDVSIWPRPYQAPFPKCYLPFTGSKETIEFAAKHNFNAVIPHLKPGVMEDVTGYFGERLSHYGHTLTPEHIVLFTDTYVASNKAEAIKEYSPYFLYFQQTLWHHGSRSEPGARAIPTSAPDRPCIRAARRGRSRRECGRATCSPPSRVLRRCAAGCAAAPGCRAAGISGSWCAARRPPPSCSASSSGRAVWCGAR